MKIDIDSELLSESASKKLTNARALLGKDADKILKKLELLSREKAVSTQGIDGLLLVLKKGNSESLSQYANSAQGKKSISRIKDIYKAKDFFDMIDALKKFKISKSLSKSGSKKTSVRNGKASRPKFNRRPK